MPQAQKFPALVSWTGYLAIALCALLPLSVLMVRSGTWQQGLLLYAISCLGATALLAVFVLLLMLPRYGAWRPAILGRALFAVPGTVLLGVLLAGRGEVPPIHDITTDTADPPVFTAAPARRGAEANSLDIVPATIDQQRQFYPGLQTLVIDMPLDDAFERAVRVARNLGWEIYLQDRNAGVIEAVDTTRIMRFKDDVVIRLRRNADGTLVDLRSVSRVGIGDMGTNAGRIRRFLDAFES